MSSQDESNQEPVGAPEGWPDGEAPLRTEPVAVADEGMLIVDVGGFEGPLDLLLELARQHKVDLKHISILKLAEQYLEFIERARKLQLEIAADYLVDVHDGPGVDAIRAEMWKRWTAAVREFWRNR